VRAVANEWAFPTVWVLIGYSADIDQGPTHGPAAGPEMQRKAVQKSS